MHYALRVGLAGTAWVMFLAAVVWPTLALAWRCIGQSEAPDAGYTFTARQMGLLWRSVWMASVATLGALALSVPGAMAIGRSRGGGHTPLLVFLLGVLLLTPPMVLALGWNRLLPIAVGDTLRCLMIWSLWMWPIPAMIIGAGWSRVGRSAYEAALLTVSPWLAFVHVGLGVLRSHVALSAAIVFVLCFGDYGTPHACSVTVFSTELLGWAMQSTRVINTIWPSLPALCVVGALLVTMFAIFRRRSIGADYMTLNESPVSARTRAGAVTIGLFVVAWALPMAWLMARLDGLGQIRQAVGVYGRDLGWSIGTAVVAAAASLVMGLGIIGMHRVRRWVLLWCMLLGAIPGALIGVAMIAAYNHETTALLYDDWPIVALTYVTRFGWIGMLTALAATRAHPLLIEQARTDGAGDADMLSAIRLPLVWPTLLAGGAIVVALALSDVAASNLIRVPTFNSLAAVLMEKFHRFEDGMLVSISLVLALAAIPPAVLAALIAKRRAAL